MITKVFKSGNSMALRIPKELEPREGEMHIERKGKRWIVEPVNAKAWPRNFFKKVRINNPEFSRPDQGGHRSFDT
jgi:virulence-associated protein VagC